MNIHQISIATAPKTSFKTSADVTNPQVYSSPEKSEIINDKGAQALKNYFIGTQNIPSFKGFSCSTGEFNKNMMYVTCACCGKKMINGSENAEKLGNQFLSVKGEDRLNFIDENMEIFRPVEKALARGIRKASEENPDKKTAELFSILRKSPREVLKNGQLYVLEDVDTEAKKQYGEKNKVSEFIKSQKEIINGRENNYRENFIKTMDEITTKLGDEEAKGKVLNKAIDMPFEEDFYKKITSTNALKFSRGMFMNAVKTAEHIHPKSLGGPNSTTNYMSECNECNENRQNYDLNTYWQTRYPSMPYNVQQYANTVTKQIIDGEIGAHFADYPIDLEKAVESETQGVIDLKVLNPEEINKKREEKGLKPLPAPTSENIQKERDARNTIKLTPKAA